MRRRAARVVIERHVRELSHRDSPASKRDRLDGVVRRARRLLPSAAWPSMSEAERWSFRFQRSSF